MEEKTKYQLSTSMNEGILEIVFTGEVTKDTVEKIHIDAITTIQDKKPRAILADIRGLKGRYDDFADAFFRTRSIPSGVRIVPSAIVDVSENKDYQSFYETTAANAGQSLKWFRDIEPARTWLKSKFQKSHY